jgi:3-isopropylmalate dehydrogenase
MVSSSELLITVLPGDGIGPEVMTPCLQILEKLERQVGGFSLRFEHHEAGAGLFQRTGTAISDETLKRAEAADAVLFGAMGLPDVRYPDGREIQPQLDLREAFDLFAGVRPVKTYPGLRLPLSDDRARQIDFVLVRESTEGLFSSRNTENRQENAAEDTLLVTREASRRVFQFAFDLARRRKERGHPGKVTLVDKANVLGSMAYFRKLFVELASENTDLQTDCSYVDAMALTLIRNPWVNDVLVTENMFGDILSDAGAALMGGMGFAPSADIGEKHAVFQPCHGTAPDIAGSGRANPTAMFLSGAMMLDWLGETRGIRALTEAGEILTQAVENAFAGDGLHPYETDGRSGLEKITGRVLDSLP